MLRSFATLAIIGLGVASSAAFGADDSAKQPEGAAQQSAPPTNGSPTATADSAAKGELKSSYTDFAKVADEGHKKFMAAGCNGCHGGASATLPFQHVAAPADWSSPAQLSRFLYDPDADSDELERRSDVQYRLSAASCTPASEAPGYSGR